MIYTEENPGTGTEPESAPDETETTTFRTIVVLLDRDYNEKEEALSGVMDAICMIRGVESCAPSERVTLGDYRNRVHVAERLKAMLAPVMTAVMHALIVTEISTVEALQQEQDIALIEESIRGLRAKMEELRARMPKKETS